MAKIKPFKAVTYNQDKLRDYSKVVCPPYDIISHEKQEYYYKESPYNLIHILLGQDVPGEDKYARAARYFKEWLKEGILLQDKEPAIYFYSQQYAVKREKKTRLGFISLMRLEAEGTVYKHENTRLEPKEDRLKLLKRVKANLSPIFAVFLDHKRIIQRVYRKLSQGGEPPFIDVTDDEGGVHKVWRLSSADAIAGIQESLYSENIFIADGHHRYEVACNYRDQMNTLLGGKASGEEGFNYILTYFTNTDFKGLTILPVHRLLKLEAKFDLEGFQLKLAEDFDVEEIKDKVRFFFLMEKCGRTEHVLGIYKDRKYFLLRLKNIKILDKMIAGKSKEYRSLDVSILNHLMLKKILGLDLESKDNIKFGPDAQEFINEADSDQAKIVFFLNPVKIQEVISVALNAERMPPKSTYFYPKVLSGLVINKLD